jgi:hypothetical protein
MVKGLKDRGGKDHESEAVMHDSTRDLTGSHASIRRSGSPTSNLRSALAFVLSTSTIFGSFHSEWIRRVHDMMAAAPRCVSKNSDDADIQGTYCEK